MPHILAGIRVTAMQSSSPPGTFGNMSNGVVMTVRLSKGPPAHQQARQAKQKDAATSHHSVLSTQGFG